MAAVLPIAGWGAGGSAFVANLTAGPANGLSRYDVGAGGPLAAKSPATVPRGVNPIAVAVSPDGKSVYVTNSDRRGAAACRSTTSGRAAALVAKTPPTVAGGPVARSGWRSARTARVSMSPTPPAPTVSQYDVGAGGLLSPKTPATVADGLRSPPGVAVSPDGTSVYVTNMAAAASCRSTTSARAGPWPRRRRRPCRRAQPPNGIAMSPGR